MIDASQPQTAAPRYVGSELPANPFFIAMLACSERKPGVPGLATVLLADDFGPPSNGRDPREMVSAAERYLRSSVPLGP
jgi:hypothetical protein